jgi:transposase-like protein
MAQFLHGCARTTGAVRLAIQYSQESIRALATRYSVSLTAVRNWRKQSQVGEAAMGPKEIHSSVLTPGEEAAVVASRRHTLLPLDDCLYALQPTIPHLTRYRLLSRRHR